MATASKGHIVAVPEGSVPPTGATEIPKGIKISAAALIKATSKVTTLREFAILLPRLLLLDTLFGIRSSLLEVCKVGGVMRPGSEGGRGEGGRGDRRATLF